MGPACQHCGTPLIRKPMGRPPSKFCSPKCKDSDRAARQREVRLAARAGRQCLQCGTAIAAEAPGKAKTCSRTCGVQYQNAVRAAAKLALKLATREPCAECGGDIPPERHGGARYCSPECKKRALDARWRAKSPGYMRQYLYGLTPEQFAEMMAGQAGRCAICRSPDWPGKGNRPHVDHDHATGAVRGLLCGKCNVTLGNMDDDPARLRAAAEYLERFAAMT